jgi:hypothetical protein
MALCVILCKFLWKPTAEYGGYYHPPCSAEEKIGGDMPILPHASSWRGAKLRTGTSLHFHGRTGWPKSQLSG